MRKICTYHAKEQIMEELNKWYDDLIWCPSQCYYYFMHEGDMYCIYLRWRHDDPWTVEIIKCADGDFDLNYETCIWKYIKVPFFKDEELDNLMEKYAIFTNYHTFIASGTTEDTF